MSILKIWAKWQSAILGTLICSAYGLTTVLRRTAILWLTLLSYCCCMSIWWIPLKECSIKCNWSSVFTSDLHNKRCNGLISTRSTYGSFSLTRSDWRKSRSVLVCTVPALLFESKNTKNLIWSNSCTSETTPHKFHYGYDLTVNEWSLSSRSMIGLFFSLNMVGS